MSVESEKVEISEDASNEPQDDLAREYGDSSEIPVRNVVPAVKISNLAESFVADVSPKVEVGSDGGILSSSSPDVTTNWKKLEIDARIIEADEATVTLECLIDPGEGIIEERIFEREPIEDAVPIEFGAYVVVRILEARRKRMFVFIDGSKRREAIEARFNQAAKAWGEVDWDRLRDEPDW